MSLLGKLWLVLIYGIAENRHRKVSVFLRAILFYMFDIKESTANV